MNINPKRASVDQQQGLRDMCRWLRGQIRLRDMMEIGSWMGESALVFAMHFGRVICVDPFEGKFKEALPKFLAAVEGVSNIEHCRAFGCEAREYFYPHRFDFVYIDAIHEYGPVKSDIAYWRKHARAVGGHDYGGKFLGVKQAVDEAFGNPDMVFQDSSWVKVLQ